jgi:DNA-directed RNA polymerase subunit RPC12/RpoP
MERILAYEVDLTKIHGSGDFQCPKCGSNISPDDETDSVYCILEPAVIDNDLQELIIQCQKCGSIIRLTGFSNIDF